MIKYKQIRRTWAFFCDSWHNCWGRFVPWIEKGTLQCPCRPEKHDNSAPSSTFSVTSQPRTSEWYSAPTLSLTCCATCLSNHRTSGISCSSSSSRIIKCSSALRSCVGISCSCPAPFCTSSRTHFSPPSTSAHEDWRCRLHKGSPSSPIWSWFMPVVPWATLIVGTAHCHCSILIPSGSTKI